MSIQYDLYLTQHIKNVGRGLAWLRTNLPDILREGEFLEVNYDLQFQQHDASKYDKEEYDAYDAYFYGPTRSYKVVQNFNRAWLHHIHNNPHHWQHWVLLEDDPSGGNVCIEMPHCYVVEMICDWWAFSWAKDDLTEIFSWWDKHKDIVQLHKNTRKTVLDILERIRAKLDEEGEDSLAHHGIKGQKWGVRRTPEELNAARGLASEEKPDTIKRDGPSIIEVSTTSLEGPPNGITQVTHRNGGIDRNYYDESGRQTKQVSNNDHGNPKRHNYGEHGEHAHDYVYNDDGQLVARPIRELTDDERKENGDIL